MGENEDELDDGELDEEEDEPLKSFPKEKEDEASRSDVSSSSLLLLWPRLPCALAFTVGSGGTSGGRSYIGAPVNGLKATGVGGGGPLI